MSEGGLVTFPRERLGVYGGARVVVLGASGFIGRWVARALSAAGAKLYLPVRDVGEARNVFDDYEVEGQLFEIDLSEEAAVKRLFVEARPTITFNLAGYGVDPSERDEKRAGEINGAFVARLCEVVSEIAADTAKDGWLGQRIVHIGSALEYGPLRGDLAEDSTPQPTTIYGKSKLAGTDHLTTACHSRELSGLTARLFTVYGPGEHEIRLLPSLLRAAMTGESVPLTDGRQRRDFTFVEDVADGLLALGAGPALPAEIINVASGTLVAVGEFARTAARVLGISQDRLQFGALPTRSEEMWHSEVNVDRLRRRLGWAPPPTVEVGIQKTREFLETLGARPR